MAVQLGVHGAAGRMGQRVVALAASDRRFKVVAALESADCSRLNDDAGMVAGINHLGVPICSDLNHDQKVDVIIDFSSPSGVERVLKLCREHKLPLVLATTGLDEKVQALVDSTAHHIAILQAANFSLVVNVLFELSKQAGRMLNGKNFDVEIVERHHRFKKDSPSGTALHFAKVIQEQMNQNRFVHGREGLVGERPEDEIGIHAVRVGDNVGEHTVIFSTLGETMELVHRGHSRDSYVLGALAAARFLSGKPAGTYTMTDVLGLDSH
jgi:4-hydroxy-tetrahydrodipicolinate reductase